MILFGLSLDWIVFGFFFDFGIVLGLFWDWCRIGFGLVSDWYWIGLGSVLFLCVLWLCGFCVFCCVMISCLWLCSFVWTVCFSIALVFQSSSGCSRLSRIQSVFLLFDLCKMFYPIFTLFSVALGG